MQLGLTEEQELLRHTFAELFAAESSTERVRAAEATGFDPGLWKHLIETGAIGIRVPEGQGGSGGGLHDAAILAEQAGRALASAPLVEAICAAGLLARIEGDRARALLAEILGGGCIPALALRELDQSAAQLVPGGAAADAVLAQDGDALVLLRRPRSAAEAPVANLGSSALARWRLDAAPPGGERVDPGARQRRARRLRAAREEWRLLTAAALTGLAQRALEIGADYAKSRIQFDRPIGAFQGVAHPLADAATAVSASQLLVQYAIWSIATAQPEAAARICFAFAAAAESAGTATARALHAHGGYGLSLEYDIQLYYRRAKAWALAGGDPRDELLRAAARLWDEARSRSRCPTPVPARSTSSLGPEAERFRAEARAFFERALTPELRAKAHFSWDGHDAGFQKELARAGLLFPHWPRAYGGRESSAYETAALCGGIPSRGLVDACHHHDRHGRRDADPIRERGAQARGAAAHPRGRGGHQPRLHRARVGLGRRGRADARRARRRPLGDRRPEDVHERRAPRAVRLPAHAHRPERRRSTTDSRCSWCRSTRPASRSSRCTRSPTSART